MNNETNKIITDLDEAIKKTDMLIDRLENLYQNMIATHSSIVKVTRQIENDRNFH